MATSTFDLDLGYGLDQQVTISGTVETDAPGASGLYVKLFCPTDTETGNPLVADVRRVDVPLRCERRYELPSGAPIRVEVDATAGSSGAPLTFTATTNDGRMAQGSGLTNETLSVEIA